VVTIHDLAYMKHPGTVPFLRRIYYVMAITQTMRSAALILTDARVMADELRAFGASAPIVPVHLGVDTERFHPDSGEMDEAILREHGVQRPYVLFVGTQEPRKNLRTLMQAFLTLREWESTLELALIGRYGWKVEEGIFEQMGVRRIGYIEEAHLPALYRQAAALAAPSLYEGFDLPAYEALACGTPVIASDIDVHREVLGEHARFIPTQDATAWAEALYDVEKLPRVEHFHARDWTDVSRETVAAWEKGLSSV
jgi:glycosyltransferase involved in cell wall biosynthesis